MNAKQRQQFNKMIDTLRLISANYQTPDKLRCNSERDFGLPYHEALELAYEDIQQEARSAVHGVRKVIT